MPQWRQAAKTGAPQEALLAIAQPGQQMHQRAFSLRSSPTGWDRSFEEHVDLLQHRLFMVNRCSQASQSFEKLQAVGELFENLLGDDMVLSCQIEHQQVI